MHLHTLLAALLPALATAQSADLAGKVGPLTSIADKKATKTCDITDYGATTSSSDISDALNKAHADCKSGGVVVVPEGNFNLASWVKLAGGSGWAFQLDGTITRTGTDEGNMVFVEHTSDFEFFSSTSQGAIQGHGHEMHGDGKAAGPRLLRFYDMQHFSVHDIALVDAPMFHLSLDTCDSGEVYNMVIRGGDMGGLDGIDVWSTNIWVHDVEVTNKDECVTVKSPSKNILVENIYCNWSGGCGMGSLGEDTNISAITYKNIYTQNSNQMYMVKANGGGGTVSDVVLENFIGHSNAYGFNIDQYWSSMSSLSGSGVSLSNFKISNWTGDARDGLQRGPIKLECADDAPCSNIDIEDFAMWTQEGDAIWYSCRSAYTSLRRAEPLFCLQGDDDNKGYEVVTKTVSAKPSGYTAAPTMSADLSKGFGTTESIAVPAIPTSFFPGVAPYSKLAGSS